MFRCFFFFFLSEGFPCYKFIRNKINLNEISHDSAMGLIDRVLKMGVLLTEVKLSPTYMLNIYQLQANSSMALMT